MVHRRHKKVREGDDGIKLTHAHAVSPPADPVRINPVDGSIQVDLESLQAPERSYDADVAWVRLWLGAVRLSFGRLAPSGDALSSCVEIRYPPEAFLHHFWANSRTFHETIRRHVAKFPADPDRDALDPTKLPVAKDFSDTANFEAMMYNGMQAAVDFYRMPAKGLALFARGRGTSGLSPEAILRIHLMTGELGRLLDLCERLIPRVEAAAIGAAKELEP